MAVTFTIKRIRTIVLSAPPPLGGSPQREQRESESETNHRLLAVAAMTSKLKLAAVAVVHNVRKNSQAKTLKLERLDAKELVDVEINPRRVKSRRWRADTVALWGSKTGVSEAKVIPAYDYGLLEDNEDAYDYVDYDQTPEASSNRARVTAILAKPWDERTAADIEFLCTLVKGVHFFEKRTDDERDEILRTMTLRTVSAHEKVVQIGAPASAFYLIFQGAARVYMPIDENDEDTIPSQDEGVSDNLSNTHVLEDGDSFGEQGLRLAEDGSEHTRKFEVIAARPTLLFVLERSGFETSMERLRKAFLRRRADLLRGVYVFNDWKEDDLRRLAAVVSERTFDTGVTVVQQGKRVQDCMFFLVKGECRELKQVEITATQREMLAATKEMQKGRADAACITPRRALAGTTSQILLEVRACDRDPSYSMIRALSSQEASSALIISSS
eukprot:scaffold73463_cov35-Tisochrysis_lutea.AAC.2